MSTQTSVSNFDLSFNFTPPRKPSQLAFNPQFFVTKNMTVIVLVATIAVEKQKRDPLVWITLSLPFSLISHILTYWLRLSFVVIPAFYNKLANHHTMLSKKNESLSHSFFIPRLDIWQLRVNRTQDLWVRVMNSRLCTQLYQAYWPRSASTHSLLSLQSCSQLCCWPSLCKRDWLLSWLAW